MTPLELFVGRNEEIQVFQELLDPDAARWVMLVRGLSGTGKSLLIDWLRQNRCQDISNAKIQLTPNTAASDFLRMLAAQLDRNYAVTLGDKLDELERSEQQNPLVHVTAPNMMMEGKLGGRISDSKQTSNINVDLASAAELVKLERETRRLDAFISVIQPLGIDPWVLFIDEAEHLEGREFGRFLFERLVPRLRSRFPGFRLYLSGQSMPAHMSFMPHELIRAELGELKPDETTSLLEKAGVGDVALQKQVMELTSGHPLLLGMLIQDSDLKASPIDQNNRRNLPDRLDQGAVTAWIYRRILDRLPETVRPIAADLALFDWFDLSILRSSFEVELQEAAFRDLIRRSFVKEIGPGQWRCHDIVRKHLSTERRTTDPQSAASVCEKAFAAYLTQMHLRGEREGTPFFTGRLEYVRGALMSASGFSAQSTIDFITEEFLNACVVQSIDYLFGLTQMMSSEGLPKEVRALGEDTRHLLDLLNTGQSDQAAVAFSERLVSEASRLEDEEARILFRELAERLARNIGDWETVLRLVREIVEEQPSLDNRLWLAQTSAESGSVDEALQMLESIHAELGDTAEVLTAFGIFNLITGDTDKAQRYFTDAIAAAPEKAEQARLELAKILYYSDEDEEALVQVERLLEIAPQHKQAQELRRQILVWLGRYQSVTISGGEAGELMRDTKDHLTELLSDDQHSRILGAIAEDSAAVPVPVLLDYGELVAIRGQEEVLERIHAAILQNAPEAKDLVDLQRYTLLIVASKPQMVVDGAEEILARRPDLPGAYIVLSKAYQQLKRNPESRAVLERMIEKFPSMQDQVDVLIAATYLEEADTDGALNYLQEREQEGNLGAEARVIYAKILFSTGSPEQAVSVLERLIFTAGRDELSISTMIDARGLLGKLSASTNKPEQARSIANSLIELFPNNLTAAALAVEIYSTLGDEQAARTLATRFDDAPALERSVVLGALGQLAFRHYQGSPDALLAAMQKEPQRYDLFMAIGLVAQMMPPEQGAELIMKASEVSPDVVVETQRLMIEGMMADPRLRQVALMMRKSPESPPLTRLGFTMALGTHGYITLAEVRQDLSDIREEFPEMTDNIKLIEVDVLLELGETEEAGTILAPFMEPDGMSEQSIARIVRYLEQKGDWQEAANFLEMAAKKFTKDRRDLLEIRADILITHDNAEGALVALEQLEAEAPLSIGQFISRANALGELGRNHEAVVTLKDALDCEQLTTRERANGLHSLGWLQLADKCAEDAVSSFRHSLELRPKNAKGLVGLSLALEKTEQWVDAYSTLRDAIALEPNLLNRYEERLQDLRDKTHKEELLLES